MYTTESAPCEMIVDSALVASDSLIVASILEKSIYRGSLYRFHVECSAFADL